MNNYNYKQLLEMIIKDIPIKEEEKTYGVSFIGSPGIGKSTVSKILSKKLGIYVIENDKIRRTLDTVGIDSSNSQELVENLAYDRIKYMLENNTSMIIDANVLTVYPLVEQNFKNYNVKIYFVQLMCNEEEILKRIEHRKMQFDVDKNNFSRATREDYYKYLERLKKNPFPMEKIFFTINTEDDLEKQTDIFVDMINKDLYK